MFCREHIFLDMHHFLNDLFVIHFFGWSDHRPVVLLSSVIQQTCSTWKSFVHSMNVFVLMLVLMIVHAIVWAIMCRIICTIFLVGPGFEPLALQHNLLWVQGWSPCTCCIFYLLWVKGSIPWLWLPVFRPILSLAYVTRPPTNGATGGNANKKTLTRG